MTIEAKERFDQYLSKKNLKKTHQRGLIVDIFLKSAKHLTYEELYEVVKAKDKTIGLTTVYRTLKLLTESGIAKTVDFGDRVIRYENTFCSGHHDHLICIRCGKNIEILDENIEKLQREIANRYGFTLKDHTMSLYGICNEC
ncbi:MAG: transcriptional repressor [Candidatus Magnetoovum sp. WYHC-5]|nr:transcriptional repressor [Candidatus Magnetoovum sp. WYHC-5]